MTRDRSMARSGRNTPYAGFFRHQGPEWQDHGALRLASLTALLVGGGTLALALHLLG